MSRYGVSGLAPRDNTNVAQKLTLDQALVNYEPPKLEPGAVRDRAATPRRGAPSRTRSAVQGG